MKEKKKKGLSNAELIARFEADGQVIDSFIISMLSHPDVKGPHKKAQIGAGANLNSFVL